MRRTSKHRDSGQSYEQQRNKQRRAADKTEAALSRPLCMTKDLCDCGRRPVALLIHRTFCFRCLKRFVLAHVWRRPGGAERADGVSRDLADNKTPPVASWSEIQKNDKVMTECRWTEQDDGWFETQCGSSYEFTNGGPKDNHFKHCPFCAGMIE